jgi:biopolymer transport protein ExbB/TolQ
VLGVLGQFSGHYLSLMVIRDAGLVNPALVAEGIAVSLIPTVVGLTILAVSAVVWFGLKCCLNSLASR